MTNYEKLVEALRILQDKNSLSYYKRQVCKDAADAIEKLVALYEKAEMDATNLTGKLAQAEAEVERLKDSNEELRERQTYIDHYGDRWMTSAKDVPTAAYKHGYADGRDEAEAQSPKRGKWVGVSPAVDTVYCSVCGGQLFNAELETPYCPYCGAKIEVQDGSSR